MTSCSIQFDSVSRVLSFLDITHVQYFFCSDTCKSYAETTNAQERSRLLRMTKFLFDTTRNLTHPRRVAVFVPPILCTTAVYMHVSRTLVNVCFCTCEIPWGGCVLDRTCANSIATIFNNIYSRRARIPYLQCPYKHIHCALPLKPIIDIRS